MKKIIKKLIQFRDERDWQQYHTGFSLSHKLQIESAEVAELFEWNQEPELNLLEEEIADVGIILLYLCEKYDIDFKKAISEKISKNQTKYPEDYQNQNWRKP
jgi:NTP pyrophosphatase (non-canonical NTP hydrolase)